VLEMIKKQSESTQFIIATFKKELLDIGDEFFGISYENKVSTIRPIDKEKAKTVLEETEKEVEEQKDTQSSQDIQSSL
jgi:structural maintenance of chromosome 3 (chondroitin sulfate proteoglycan 6)